MFRNSILIHKSCISISFLTSVVIKWHLMSFDVIRCHVMSYNDRRCQQVHWYISFWNQHGISDCLSLFWTISRNVAETIIFASPLIINQNISKQCCQNFESIYLVVLANQLWKVGLYSDLPVRQRYTVFVSHLLEILSASYCSRGHEWCCTASIFST